MNGLVLTLALFAMHADVPTNEHNAVMALVPDAAVDVRAVVNGEWDDAATWGGVLPFDGQDVLIPRDVIVLVDHEDDARLNTIRVDGTLEFSQPSSTRLIVETIVVNEGGMLEIGTKVSPITGNATIIFLDDGPLENQSARGLLSLGMVSIYGDTKPFDTGYTSLEDGRYSPYKYKPTSPLSRTVTLVSENPEVGRRGHVMLMHHGGYSVGWATFLNLGRTDKSRPIAADNIRGRYPLHFHRCKNLNGEPIEVVGILVQGSLGWGATNHSSNVVVRDSICNDCFGAGFVGEAGDERGAFLRCLSLNSKGSGHRGGSLQIVNEARKNVGDYGHLGDGFWLQGPYIALIDDVAAGNAFSGYNCYNNGFKEPDTKAIALPQSRTIPLTESTGCLAEGSPFGRLDGYTMAEGSIVRNFTARNCDVGSHQISAIVEYHNPLYERCRIGHDGGTDYGGPTRQYNVTARDCSEWGVNVGSTRWLSGHSILDGYTGERNAKDVWIRQADIGRTDLNNLGDASLVFFVNFTKGAYTIRQRLIYGDDGKREFYKDGKRIWFPEQHPDYVPWRDGPHKGMTNQAIFDATGKLPLGSLVPVGAVDMGQYWSEP